MCAPHGWKSGTISEGRLQMNTISIEKFFVTLLELLYLQITI